LNKKVFSIIGLIVVLTALLTVISGCSGGGKNNNGNTNITESEYYFFYTDVGGQRHSDTFMTETNPEIDMYSFLYELVPQILAKEGKEINFFVVYVPPTLIGGGTTTPKFLFEHRGGDPFPDSFFDDVKASLKMLDMFKHVSITVGLS